MESVLWCLAVSSLTYFFLIQAKGGGLAFLKGNPSQLAVIDGRPSQTLLAYINGDREFVLFDPLDKEACELDLAKQDDLVAHEETGGMTLLLLLMF